MIKCDIAMKRSKERAEPYEFYQNLKFRCDNNCSICICGMKKNDDGTWEHNTFRKDGRKR